MKFLANLTLILITLKIFGLINLSWILCFVPFGIWIILSLVSALSFTCENMDKISVTGKGNFISVSGENIKVMQEGKKIVIYHNGKIVYSGDEK